VGGGGFGKGLNDWTILRNEEAHQGGTYKGGRWEGGGSR